MRVAQTLQAPPAWSLHWFCSVRVRVHLLCACVRVHLLCACVRVHLLCVCSRAGIRGSLPTLTGHASGNHPQGWGGVRALPHTGLCRKGLGEQEEEWTLKGQNWPMISAFPHHQEQAP